MLAVDTFAVARPQPAGDNLTHIVDTDEAIDGTVAAQDIVFVYGKDASAPDVAVDDNVFAGDWGGLGFDQVGVARNNTGQKQILLDTDRDTDPEYLFHFGIGTGNAEVIAGDFNGDGFDDVGVWFADPGPGGGIIIHLKYASPTGDAFPRDQSSASPVTPDAVFQFGLKATDVIRAGDFTGDGRTDIAAIRNNGAAAKDWFISNAAASGAPFPNNNSVVPVSNTYQFGLTSHVPIVGDWDGNGTDNFGAISIGTGGGGVNEWLLDTNFDPTAERNVRYGLPGDIPYVGNFADVLWDGGGATDDWSVATNWSGDMVPVALDSVLIDQPGSLTVNYDSGVRTYTAFVTTEAIQQNGGTLVLQDNIQIASLHNFGGTLHLRSDVDIDDLQISNDLLVENVISVSDPLVLISGSIRVTGAFGGFFNNLELTGGLQITGSQTIGLDGNISGTGNLVINNVGDTQLSGNNTFAGDVTVNSGTVNLFSPTSIPATANLSLSGGGAVFSSSTSLNVRSISGTTSGGISVSSLIFGDATNKTYNGPITSSDIIKQGTGTFTFGPSTTIDGSVTASEGRVVAEPGVDFVFGGVTIQGGAVFENRTSTSLSMYAMTGASPRLELGGAADLTAPITFSSAVSPTIATVSPSDTIDVIGGLSGSVAGTGVQFDGRGTFLWFESHDATFTGTSTSSLINGTDLEFNAIWPATSDFTVGANSRLSGNGTFGGAVIGNGANATLAPGTTLGNDMGVMNVGSLTFSSASANLELNIGGTGSNAGLDYDQIISSGTVTLGSTLGLIGTNAVMGETYTIITNNSAGAVVGNFNGLPEGGTFIHDGLVFVVSYVGGDGNDVTLFAESAVVAWDGGGDGTSWNDPLNWVGDLVPAVGSDVVIDVPGTPTIVSSVDVMIGSLTSQEAISITGGLFESSGNVSAPSFIVAGGNYVAGHSLTTAAFAMNSGILTVTPNTSISDVNLVVSGGTIQTAGSGTEIIFGNWMALTGDVTINIDNDLALSGLHSGIGGIIKEGSSVLRLTNNNSYAGLTTINAGEIYLTNVGLLGSTASGTVVGGNARLRIGQGKINNDAVTLAGVNPSLLTFAGAPSFQDGDVILAAVDDANILTSNQLVVRGQISGSVSGAGRFNAGGTAENLTLQFQPSVDNTYSATTLLADGNLQTLTSDVIVIPGDIVVGDGDGARVLIARASQHGRPHRQRDAELRCLLGLGHAKRCQSVCRQSDDQQFNGDGDHAECPCSNGVADRHDQYPALVHRHVDRCGNLHASCGYLADGADRSVCFHRHRIDQQLRRSRRNDHAGFEPWSRFADR